MIGASVYELPREYPLAMDVLVFEVSEKPLTYSIGRQFDDTEIVDDASGVLDLDDSYIGNRSVHHKACDQLLGKNTLD